MTLAEMQSCLARLYVSAEYREQLRCDSDAALAKYVLAPDEAAAVRDIDQRMLEFFAGTLISKRLRRAQRTYSSSFAYNDAAMRAFFHRFYEMQGCRCEPTVHHEAVAFGRFAEECLSDTERFDAVAAELVRYERFSYEATFLRSAPPAAPPFTVATVDRPALAAGVIVGEFTYDVVTLDAALRAGDTDVKPQPLSATIVFCPGRAMQEQRMLRLNGASASVLRSCDGRTPAHDIAARVQRSLGAAGFDEAIFEALQRLADIGILTVRPHQEAN